MSTIPINKPVIVSNAPIIIKSKKDQFTSLVNCIAINGIKSKSPTIGKILIIILNRRYNIYIFIHLFLYISSTLVGDFSGIFIDEMSTETSTLSYYEELYEYILSKTGLDEVHGNPGVSSEEAFVSAPATTSLVISENYMSEWPSYSTDSWVNEYDASRFSMLVHTASTISEMQTAIDLAVQRNIGLLYVTDDAMPNPWDMLPTYWQEKVKYIKSLNQGNDSEEPTFTDIDTNGDGCISEEEFDNASDGN